MKYTKPPLTFEQQANQLPKLLGLLIAVLSVLLFLVQRIAPQSGWKDRVIYLWETKHPQIPIRAMGFPENWQESPIWNFDEVSG